MRVAMVQKKKGAINTCSDIYSHGKSEQEHNWTERNGMEQNGMERNVQDWNRMEPNGTEQNRKEWKAIH